GQPIARFFLQEGTVNSNRNTDVTWNPHIDGPIVAWEDGRFFLNMEKTQQVWRIMSPGYSAETVSAQSAHLSGPPDIVVRMKPAGAVRGVVLDHQGYPAAGAKVSVTTLDPNTATNTAITSLLTNTATTDADGRFSLLRS